MKIRLSKEEITEIKLYNKYVNDRSFDRGKIRKYEKIYYIVVSIVIRFVGLIRSITFLFKSPEEVDILYLPQCAPDLERLDVIDRRLAVLNITITKLVQRSRLKKLVALKYGWVPLTVPAELVATYAESVYYLNRYQPKVVVFVQNFGVLPVLVRRGLMGKGITVNLAHSVTYNDWLFSLYDFDYYFMFGNSSLDHAQSNKYRFGSTCVVKTGRFFMDQRLVNMSAGKPGGNIAYFSHFLRSDLAEATVAAHNLLIEFASRNPGRKILVKLHPLEHNDYWEKQSNLENIIIVESGSDLVDLLASCSLSIVQYSNACIESAIAKRPVISIDMSNFGNNYLKIDSFFPTAKDVFELEEIIQSLESNYLDNIIHCERFAKYHLEKTEGSQEYVAELLCKLTRGENIEGKNILQNYNRLCPD